MTLQNMNDYKNHLPPSGTCIDTARPMRFSDLAGFGPMQDVLEVELGKK
jgi:hypothetical protein